MNKCNLCQRNNADRKGSHIVPHFLLKRIENIDGKTGRDYEIGYEIGRLKASPHFGRSVPPEKLEEIFGKITDNEIDNNQHPLIADYFLCSECEDRLAQIESKYSQTINTIDKTEYKSGISSSSGMLFWISVFWRMSVYRGNGMQLTAEQNELLRGVLDYHLSKNDDKFLDESNLINILSYKIIRCHNCEQNDAKWLLFNTEFCNSLCLFIDEFVVVLSLNGHYDEFKPIDCFGINDLILDAPTNTWSGNEVIKPFDRSIFIELCKRIAYKMTLVYIDGLGEFFDEVYVAAGGKGDKMPENVKREIMESIVSNEIQVGRKYTPKDIVNSTCEVMSKHGMLSNDLK